MNPNPDAADITRTAGPNALPGTARRLLVWAGAGVAVAICIVILAMWGIHGPNYLLDLIAAYCA
jgi:hypothetical protein